MWSAGRAHGASAQGTGATRSAYPVSQLLLGIVDRWIHLERCATHGPHGRRSCYRLECSTPRSNWPGVGVMRPQVSKDLCLCLSGWRSYDRWLADTDSNSAMFEGNPGSTDFYSRAPTALRTLSRRPRRPTQTRLSTDHLGSQRHHDDVGRHLFAGRGPGCPDPRSMRLRASAVTPCGRTPPRRGRLLISPRWRTPW
jgi:hypothetical protein